MNLESEPAQPPRRSGLLSQDEGCFWPLRPGGGREGADLVSRGTFHSSWAREELEPEPEPGDHAHLESLVLAAVTERQRARLRHRLVVRPAMR